jgi:ribosomal protein S18 acetylase RimI-like enzyme
MTRDSEKQDGVAAGRVEDDRVEAERLLELCNQDEGLDLPIAVDPALAGGEATTQFRAYRHGALVGFAWLPPEPEPEACLMVHPAHRRQGVGRELLAAIQTEVRRRGLAEFLGVCDEASPSGMAFVVAVGGRYRNSEYRLELDPAAVDRSRPRHAALHLSPAGAANAEDLIRLLVASFGNAEEAMREQTGRMLNDPTRRHFLAVLGTEPVGLLRIGVYEDYADVTAFGVLPTHRGRGYGRQMLLDAVDLLLSEGHQRIIIEVATNNSRALGLYRSCGFKVTTAYGFYDIAA